MYKTRVLEKRCRSMAMGGVGESAKFACIETLCENQPARIRAQMRLDSDLKVT